MLAKESGKMPPLRRKDRALSQEQALQILRSGEMGVLATADSAGIPLATPLNYVCWNGAIYFHCAIAGHKLENLRVNVYVSFCVVGAARILPEALSTAYRSVIVKGRACLVVGEEKRQALAALLRRFGNPGAALGEECLGDTIDRTAVVRISIDDLCGKGARLDLLHEE
jgi:nitroimidazol reductase NimA-like FMN-containing flavoprotein (pyridoxamine 5'-phosphate oxidase superfamily)